MSAKHHVTTEYNDQRRSLVAGQTPVSLDEDPYWLVREGVRLGLNHLQRYYALTRNPPHNDAAWVLLAPLTLLVYIKTEWLPTVNSEAQMELSEEMLLCALMGNFSDLRTAVRRIDRAQAAVDSGMDPNPQAVDRELLARHHHELREHYRTFVGICINMCWRMPAPAKYLLDGVGYLKACAAISCYEQTRSIPEAVPLPQGGFRPPRLRPVYAGTVG